MPDLKVLKPRGAPELLGNSLPSFARRTRSQLVGDREGPRLQKRSEYLHVPKSLGAFLTHVVTWASQGGPSRIWWS